MKFDELLKKYGVANSFFQLKIKQPNSVKLEEVESEMLKNFYRDSKRVDNKKMKDFFKYNLKFPTYLEGLTYIFNNSI